MDAITVRAAKATAQGIAQGSGVTPTASSGVPPAIGGSGGGGGAGGAGGGGSAGGGANFGRFNHAVRIFAQAVSNFAQNVGKVATGGGGTGGSGAGTGGTGGGGRGSRGRAPSFLGSIMGGGANTAMGQMMRTGLFGGGTSGRFLGHFLGNLPPVGQMTAGGVGSAALRGVGGAMAGSAGAAMATNPIGMLVLAGKMLVENTKAAMGHLQAAVTTFASSMTKGDASGAIHGTIEGFKSLRVVSPLLGESFAKAVGVLHTFVNAMDDMVSNLGKYNGATAAAIGIYEAQQVMFKVQASQLLQPMMTMWVQLKSKVLDLLLRTLQALAPILNAAGTALITVFEGLVEVMKPVIELFKSLASAMLKAELGAETIKQKFRVGADAAAGAKHIADLKKEIKDLSNSPSGLSNDDMRKLAHDMMAPTGTGGAFGKKAGGAMPGSMLMASAVMAAVFGNGIPQAPSKKMFDSQFPSGAWGMDPNSPGHSYMKGKITGHEYMKGKITGHEYLHRKPHDGMLGLKVFYPEPGDNPEGAPAGKNPAANMTAKPPVIDGGGVGNFPGIVQNVNLELNMKLANDRAVLDAMFQIREKLLRGIGVARDETRLLAGMLDAGLSAGL